MVNDKNITENSSRVNEVKLEHVYNFLKEVKKYADNYYYVDSSNAYKRLINELESKLAIEDTVYRYSNIA